MDLERLRTDLGCFLAESEDLYWRNWIGVQDAIDVAAVFDRYAGTFSADTVRALRRELAAARDPEAVRERRHLLGQVTLSHMEYATRHLNQEVLRREAATWVRIDGRRVALRALGPRIRNEPDAARRALLRERQQRATRRRVNPVRAPMVEGFFATIAALGYADYAELCQETQDRDYEAFAREMSEFLDASEDLYRRELDRYLRAETGVPRARASTADISFMSRFNRFDRYFPQAGLLPAVQRTWIGLGFDLAAQPNITLDLVDREKKVPRACVIAVAPPDDVRLNILPMGGYDDYAGFLHESGHAQHFAHMRRDLPLIYRYWGDRGFTEGTAYLFQHLTQNPVWLAEMVGFEDSGEFLRVNAFLDLMHIRRLISQFLYQFELFRSRSLAGMPERYRRIMGRGQGVAVPSAGYLSFDTEFYSAGYVRARLFERRLRAIMVERFGPDWWRKERAGRFLLRFYTEGRRVRAEEVLEQLGRPGLDPMGYLAESAKLLE